MNTDVYQFDILRATRATDLHALRCDIVADDLLDSAEKDELCRLIAKTFGQLNAAAAGKQKPRWQ